MRSVGKNDKEGRTRREIMRRMKRVPGIIRAQISFQKTERRTGEKLGDAGRSRVIS